MTRQTGIKRYHYTRKDIIKSLRQVGIVEGDLIFSHIALLPLGLLKEMQDGESLVEVFVDAIKSVLGPEGSFITPTFSYSFCNSAPFDTYLTPSAVGAFSEAFRRLNNVTRSEDPLFSVAGFGPHLIRLFSDLPNSSFGSNSFFYRLLFEPCKICNIGLDLRFLTPIHALEQSLNVPYRFDKLFSGELNGRSSLWQYYVRFMCENSEPNCLPLQQVGESMGIVKHAKLGRGQVYSVNFQEYVEIAKKEIDVNPWFLTKGPALTNENLLLLK